ncbi:MAG: hypothetical protein A2Z21_03615 [Candidatus Fraserbacteria bacterium RBG_16_55_9]|uniref:Uncharacterized protein n=1 Tax=Fraserbacteria sp. (strain RBG_16_55_9) TaxID=1817864 RepID=A0A1F5UZ66_FRAXR|nr:MAG: hypothetical protein A2Z21_03615 [Candidatus Fraserbacteria bacterium RBG_16_55_9]
MGITLVIRVFTDQPFQIGRVSFTGEQLNEIAELFPNFLSLSIEPIEGAIGIFAKSKDKNQPAKKLKVQTFEKTPTSVSVRFSVESDLTVSSGDLTRCIKAQLRREGIITDDRLLPLCCVLTAEQADAVLRSPTALEELRQLKRRKDWRAIYDKFVPIKEIPQNQPEIWNDAEILSEIGFACGKLAETSPNDIPRVEQHKENLSGSTEKISRRNGVYSETVCRS